MNCNGKQKGILNFLYNTAFGRVLLRPLASRRLSQIVGRFLDSRLSRCLIPSFIKKNNIDLHEYETSNFDSFNNCFCRKMRPEKRPIDLTPGHIISPCDGLLTVYKVKKDTVLPVKQSKYTLSELVNSTSLAKEFEDGWCFVFRLCVSHYHRYCYAESGVKGKNIFIPGALHTVRPIALESRPVFVQNCREYTEIETSDFGKIVQMEVGAMLVGKICNYDGARQVSRGAEKGRFLYGGSTIILLLKKDAIAPEALFINNSGNGIETPVKMGEKIGAATNRKFAVTA